MSDDFQQDLSSKMDRLFPERVFTALKAPRQPHLLVVSFRPSWTLELVILGVSSGLLIWTLFSPPDEARLVFAMVSALMVAILLAKPSIRCVFNRETQMIEITRRFIIHPPFLRITRRYSFADITAIHILHQLPVGRGWPFVQSGFQVMLLTRDGQVIRLSDGWTTAVQARSTANKIKEHMGLDLTIKRINY